MIELLLAISLIAFAGFCLTLIWPKLTLHWLPTSPTNGLRPQYMPAEPRRVLRRPELVPSRPPVKPARNTASTPAAARTPARPVPYIPAPSYGRPAEELIRRSTTARDALARDLAVAPLPSSLQPRIDS